MINPLRRYLGSRISIVLLIFCFCLFNTTSALSQTIESLQKELKLLSEKSGFATDTLYLNKANDLGFMLAESNPDSAFVFLEKQIQLCRSAGFAKGESTALKIFGNALQNKGNFRSALVYYQDALEIAQVIPNEKLEPGIQNNIGLVYYSLGNYAEALVNFFEAINGAEKNSNSNVKAAALNNIAMIYFEQDKLDEAKSRYEEIYQIYKKAGNQGRMILALNNIGDVLLKQNLPLDALEKVKLGYESALEFKSSEFIEMTSRTMADIYAALDSSERAEELYRKSIQISSEKGYGVPYTHSLIGLAGLLLRNGNIKEAGRTARKAMKEAQVMGQSMQIRNAHELMSAVYEKEGDYISALESYRKFKSVNDSINTSNAQRLAATLESDYEFSKKELEYEKESLRQQWLFYSALAGLLIFIVILFIVFRNRNIVNTAYSNLKEKTVEINSKNEKLEKTLEQLKSTQAQLIQAEKMASLGELMAGIAHEIQNPLNFINNFSEVSSELIDEVKVKINDGKNVKTDEGIADLLEDVKQNMTIIHNHGTRADSIVKGMLEHSRKSVGEVIPTDINTLIHEYYRLSYHGMKAKDKNFKAVFKPEFDPNLPKVNVIPQEIGKVFLNLINNALYACMEQAQIENQKLLKADSKDEKSSFTPTINLITYKVTTNDGKEWVEIVITDNGTGIPEAIKDKILQPFFTTKPSGKGTGLGLSLSYDIINVYGGELKFKSKQGEGSEFKIILPI